MHPARPFISALAARRRTSHSFPSLPLRLIPRSISFLVVWCAGVTGWICSRDRIQIAEESKIFAPANLRAAQDLPGYEKLVSHWMTNRYTLRYTGGLVPDVCQQFTKRQGVFANPTSASSPAKLRLAFEAVRLCFGHVWSH
jgi:fructose-1,6-bisphosphatase